MLLSATLFFYSKHTSRCKRMSPERIDALLMLASQAGQATLAYHRSAKDGLRPALAMQVSNKADSSPVTQADLAANQIIVSGLQRLTPDIPVVSEELPDSQKFCRTSGQFWLVDPLDGTREFVAGGNDFTVNIALISDSQAVWGVVLAPAVDLMCWGGRAYGSQSRCHGRISQLRLAEHFTDQPSAVLRVVASKSHLDQATRSFIDYLQSDSAGQRRGVELVQAGSSLKFCKIAQGEADIYPRMADTSQWDTAAAQAVLEGAGGVVCDLSGQRLTYGRQEILNPHFIASSVHPQRWLNGWTKSQKPSSEG